MTDDKPSCFIIMPITTPEACYKQYKDDTIHFEHVQDHLFIPAIKKAGLEPLLPKSTGSEIIHAEIIEKLTKSEMVLCDMSILNANVFFELGVRTSLNKPVALIVDDKTPKIPFDLSNVNRHEYKSALNTWELEYEIDKLAQHIKATFEKSHSQNALWKIFKILDTAEFTTSDVTGDDKFNLLFHKIESIQSKLEQPNQQNYKVASLTRDIEFLNLPSHSQEFMETTFRENIDLYIDKVINFLNINNDLTGLGFDMTVDRVFETLSYGYSHCFGDLPIDYIKDKIIAKI